MMDLKNNRLGQIFTPDYVAEFMVKNIENLYFASHSKVNLDQVKVLEPCAGEGIFLKYLLREGFSDITAYELDATLKPSLLETFPEVKFRFENFMGTNLEEKYDIIIGNPPYLGQNYNAKVFRDLVRRYPICQEYFVGNMDLFYYFIHLGILKLKPGALLSYITTNYWITKSKKTGITKLKPHLIHDCFFIEYVDLSNLRIFQGAKGQHNCIFLIEKKTEKEKIRNIDKPIQIIQFPNSISNPDLSNLLFSFGDASSKSKTAKIVKYTSALSNKHLCASNSWNLLYPKEAQKILGKIEKFCEINHQMTFLKDFCFIRNGLILVKDDIFILKEKKNLLIEENDWFIKINEKLEKITEKERERLKKVYKSSAIVPYSYIKGKHSGYLIYLNKHEKTTLTPALRNEKLKIKYPNLIAYLDQYKAQLKEILINAKESPLDLYFPRRGVFITHFNEFNEKRLINLENFYEECPKIFFKYISKTNIFGYTSGPYYATSDTYFLWPKNLNRLPDTIFLIAYLNSKIVSFIFKAKGISVKRSKSKLEENLPIPNPNLFKEEDDPLRINLIKYITDIIIKIQDGLEPLSLALTPYEKLLNANIVNQITKSIKSLRINSLQKIIDSLFFQLFQIDENQIDDIIKNYYY